MHSATARSIASIRRGATRRTSGAALAVEPVGDQPRRRQDVAQIVVDLGHRGAERGEPGALPERLAHGLLHRRQLALGDADLVAAGRWRTMTREASSGSSRNVVMLAVIRRIGRTSSHCRLR